MLESTSIPSSLQSLLAARSNSLESFLNFEPTQIEALLHHLTLAINIVIETVQAAREIFGLHEQDGKGGLLGALLSEIERPTNMDPSFVEAPPDSTKLGPILLSLPNYVQLQKYLPLDIVSFTPFLSLTAERNLLPPAVASREIDAWLGRATEQLVQGVTRWISDLEGGASTLAAVRTAVRGALATAGLLGIELQSQLERSMEQRLVLVYREQLAELVRRVPKCMDELLVALPGSGADTSAGYFLFEEPLSFPSPVLQLQPSRTSSSAPLLSASSSTVKKDPFEVFLGKLFKRIEGRSPLLDRGMEELELGVKTLKRDLECWLEGGEGERNQKVREAYVRSAGETLEGIVAALGDSLQAVGQGEWDRSSGTGLIKRRCAERAVHWIFCALARQVQDFHRQPPPKLFGGTGASGDGRGAACERVGGSVGQAAEARFGKLAEDDDGECGQDVGGGTEHPTCTDGHRMGLGRYDSHLA